MNKEYIIRLYNDICNRLLQLDLPDDLKDAVKKYIEDVSFIDNLHKIVRNRDYSCNSVLLLCQSLMNEVAEDNIPQNWLEYVYQYILSKSFPHAVEAELKSGLEGSCSIYLQTLREISEFQKNDTDDTWQSRYPIRFLSSEEENDLENPIEYKKFLKAFDELYVYEMMKLNQEVLGFNTLDHICGVHYLALYIGRELKKAGIPIDLGRVSGAAAGHDIGKYGCKSSESKRVPYLHYYYTDLWFRNHDITYIGHIATNHSTWDLELENLPLESLVLIYSDFRVKHDATGNTREMHIYPLQDSFKIILDKLDNLDAIKEKKYRRVYSKLADFEDYLINLGIEVDINNIAKGIRRELGIKNRHYSLMSGSQVIKNIKYLAINHNINLMYQLRD
ncbi:MAG TPA: cytidyltransferase, partial [Bacillota bacterium]|nr:cytidyltransferase [Bacillota bacterium]